MTSKQQHSGNNNNNNNNNNNTNNKIAILAILFQSLVCYNVYM